MVVYLTVKLSKNKTKTLFKLIFFYTNARENAHLVGDKDRLSHGHMWYFVWEFALGTHMTTSEHECTCLLWTDFLAW